MRKWALTILIVSIALTAGHARAQNYDPAFPVCLYVVSFGISPYYRCSYRRWSNAGRRPTVDVSPEPILRRCECRPEQ